MNEVDRLGWTLIHFVWQGALIAALYAIVRYGAARRAGPNARYLLAWATLVLMSVTPLVTWMALRPAAPVAALRAGAFLASTPAPPAVAAAALAAPAATPRELVPSALLPWIAALWCAGALLFWMRLTVGWWAAARLRATCVTAAPGEWQARLGRLQARLRVSRPVRLLVSARVAAPIVVGWLRPVVLAPACAFTGLAPEQMEAVLLHELAHIRRHDYLVNLWQNAVEALLFYHPAVWWVSGHMRAEREFCCDDMAVAASGDALGYASALAELERARPRLPELAMAASGGSLLRRIARLLGSSRDTSPAGPGLAAIVTVAGAILLCLAGLRGWSQTAPVLKFEVASVKQLAPGALIVQVGGSPSGPMLTLQAMSLADLVSWAYDVRPWQVSGGPAWAGAEVRPDRGVLNTTALRFDIAAKAEGEGTRPIGDFRQMMQQLLKDRFALAVHGADRDTPVYALVVDKHGPKLQASAPEAPGILRMPSSGRIVGSGATVTQLVNWFSYANGVDRAIVDRTGLSGKYDFTLEWSNPLAKGNSDTTRPDIFTALREQLGLRLEPQRAPLKYIVIDHAERPTAN